MKKFLVQRAQSLKDFTDETYPQGSFAFSRLLREKDVRVNGEKIGRNIPLSAGDEVIYYTTPREEARPFYRAVYRDENILIADKYAGVNAEGLFCALHAESGARFIHRLDRNTSGLMAFALNAAAERELLAAFRERRAEKIYEALCFHPFAKQSEMLTAYLKKDEKAAHVRVFSRPCAGAERIRTEYAVGESFGEYSRVEIRLHSGKTHQIRAHMAFIGHPVVGEKALLPLFRRGARVLGRQGVRVRLLRPPARRKVSERPARTGRKYSCGQILRLLRRTHGGNG